MRLSEAFQHFIYEEIQLKNGADKTRRNYITACNSLMAACGDIPVLLLTLDHVNNWVNYQQTLGHQPSSIKSNLSKLRSVLKFLRKRQINVINYKEIELPSVKRNKHTVLDIKEVRQMIEATDSLRDKAIIACLFSTGCRISELLNLNREDIQNGEAKVLGKGYKERTVFFDKTALELLQAYLDARKDRLPPLFISGQYRRITVSRVEQIIHVTTALAGIDKVVTPHVFRHSTVTDYLANGAPMAIVQRIAGHANISTTIDIYGHIPEDSIRETAKQYHSQ